MPATPHVVGTTRVLAVRDLRAVVTVRTAQGGSYTVETPNTDVKVGDVWPP